VSSATAASEAGVAVSAAPDRTVGIVTEIISPYRIPVFNALDELLDGRLRVFFLAERAGRSWPVYRSEIRFRYEVLPGLTFQPFGRGSQVLYVNRPVLGRLRREGVGPVFVGGYNHFEFAWALLHGRRASQPVILWSESVSALEGGRPVRTAVKRACVRACSAYVASGTRAAAQLVALGAAPDRVFVAPNAVDVAFWGAGAPVRAAASQGSRLLFVGNLTRNKGVDILLAALDGDALRAVAVDVVGTGPELEALRRTAQERRLNVTFCGHLDREDLRERYGACDVLVLPTRGDVWGLVLNEGMAAGCVPVTTTAAGAAGDLVEDDVTGVVLPPGDPDRLRHALIAVLSDDERRQRLAQAARARAMSYSPERCAEGFVRALEAVA
jgi:glycosyltransferase involved in cell wall biosynthesis